MVKQSLAIFLLLAADALNPSGAWAAVPPVLRGRVTCNGAPVYHALVQGLADPTSQAPLGEAYTDRDGRFALAALPGATVATAHRTVRDTTGEFRSLSATPRPLTAKGLALALDRREVRSSKVAATPDDLQFCADSRAHADTPAIEAAVAALLTAPAEERAELIGRQRDLLAARETEGSQHALEAAFKAAERTKDPAQIRHVGEVAAEIGQGLPHRELHAVGLAWQAVASLYASDAAGGLRGLMKSLPLLQEAIDAENRPGFKRNLQTLKATLLNIAAMLAEATGDGRLAKQQRTEAAALDEALERPRQAAEAHLALALLTQGEAGGAAQAHAKAALALIQHLDLPALAGKALVALAAASQGQECAQALTQAEAALMRAPRSFDVLSAMLKLGQQLARLEKREAALRVLTQAIAGLDDLPRSPQVAMQLWQALGGLGRGAVLQQLGEHPRAIADLERALGLQPKELSPEARALDHQLLGVSLEELGQHSRGRKELSLAADLLAQSKDALNRPTELQLREQVAWSWLQETPPNIATALRILDAAIARAAELQLPELAARLADTAAFACTAGDQDSLAQLEKAAAYLQRAEQLYAALEDRPALARIRKQLATARRLISLAQAMAGKAGDAEASLRAAIALFDKENQRAEAHNSRDALAMLLFEQTRWAEAAPLWEAYAAWLLTPEAAEHAKETLEGLPRATPDQRRNLEPRRQRIVTLGLLASCWQNTGQPTKAMAAMHQQIEVWEQLGEAEQALSARHTLALSAVAAGDRPTFDRQLSALQSAAKDPDAQAMVAALRILPEVLQDDLDVARQAAERLRKELLGLAQGAGQPAGETGDQWLRRLPLTQRQGFAQAWAMLGALQARLGEPVAGLEALQKASDLADPPGRAALLGDIGKLCRRLGRLQEALDAQQKVMELQAETAQFTKPSYMLATLMEVYEIQRTLGDLAAARRTLKQALAQAEQVEALASLQAEDRKILADFLGLAARQLLTAGATDQAQQLAQRAVWLYPALFRDEASAAARVTLAVAQHLELMKARTRELNRRASRPQPAPMADDTAEYLKRNQAAQQQILKAIQEAAEQLSVEAVLLGTMALHSSQPDAETKAALPPLLQDTHRRAMAAGRLVDLSPLTWLQALLAQQSGQAEAAISLYRRAIEEGEVVRSSLASDTHKVGVLENADEALYGALELLLVDQGKPAEALEISEQRRARALLDVLATGELRQRLHRGGPSQELRQLAERMQALAAQDQQLDLHLATTSVTRTDPQTGRSRAVAVAAKPLRLDHAQGRREAEALWLQLGQARQKVAGSTAEVASLVTAPLVGAQEIRGFAHSRQAVLVEWSVHAEVLLIYVVQRDGRVDVAKVPIKAQELEQLVRQARQSLGAATDRDPQRGAEAWGATAAAEAAEDPAALAKLSALLVAPIAQWLPTDPAIHVIAAPHRSLLLLPLAALPLSDGRPWLESAALSVVPSLGVLRYTAAKGSTAAKSSALVVGNPAMPLWQGSPLPPLPGAEREAAAVAKILRGTGVSLMTGAKATETRVRESLSAKRWLHFATHGVARDDQPGQSFVALAADGKADGQLSVGEVLELRLQADLVVLSACQTGLGKLSGDGVLGLGRAFLYAGTPRVVVSLWSVPDEPTALLMERFYTGLVKGLAPAEALRQAQRATRQRFADPAAWAAFVLVGEGK
jgi:CHAT domain-containing protein